MVIWICDGNFFKVIKTLDVLGRKVFPHKLSTAEKQPV